MRLVVVSDGILLTERPNCFMRVNETEINHPEPDGNECLTFTADWQRGDFDSASELHRTNFRKHLIQFALKS